MTQPTFTLLILLTGLQPSNQSLDDIRFFQSLPELLAFLPIQKLHAKLTDEVIVRRVRLVPTQIAHDLLDFLAEIQPRERGDHLLELLHADQSPRHVGAEKIGGDAKGGRRHVGHGMVQGDAGGGVQGDGVPDGVESVVVELGVRGGGGEGLALEERFGQVRAVDLKAFVVAEQVFRGGPAEVVHDDRQRDRLDVYRVEWWDLLRDDEGEGSRAEAMVDGCR